MRTPTKRSEHRTPENHERISALRSQLLKERSDAGVAAMDLPEIDPADPDAPAVEACRVAWVAVRDGRQRLHDLEQALQDLLTGNKGRDGLNETQRIEAMADLEAQIAAAKPVVARAEEVFVMTNSRMHGVRVRAMHIEQARLRAEAVQVGRDREALYEQVREHQAAIDKLSQTLHDPHEMQRQMKLEMAARKLTPGERRESVMLALVDPISPLALVRADHWRRFVLAQRALGRSTVIARVNETTGEIREA